MTTDQMIDPTPLPPEVAIDTPPLSDELLNLVAGGVIKLVPADELPYVDDAGDDDDADRAERRARLAAAAAAVHGWQISDEEEAEWAGGVFVREGDAVKSLERQAKGFHARVDRWLETEASPHRRLAALMEGKLSDWGLRERIATKGKTATFGTPSAKVATKAAPATPTLKVDGGAEGQRTLVAWLEENVPAEDLTDVIKVEKSVLVGGLKGLLVSKDDKTAAILTAGDDGKVFLTAGGEQLPNLSADHGEISVKVSAR